MQIAITRLAEKGTADQALCERYGHSARIISPLKAELKSSLVQTFVLAANGGEFDAIFFTSAYPAKHIGMHLDRNITKKCRVIAIGPQTAKILHDRGIPTETLPTFYSRDFVPYLGDWIEGKRIGIPRADVPNPELLKAIEQSGGMAFEYRCYELVPTGGMLDLDGSEAILFTSANSFSQANLPDLSQVMPIAIGDVTAKRMQEGGTNPVVVGDGSLEGTLAALNDYLKTQ